VYAKQKLSPPRPCGRFSVFLLLGFLSFCAPAASRADSLDDAARILARKVAAVPQRERHFLLSWQNHSSIADESSESLKASFTDELGGVYLAEKLESGAHILQVSIEETPAFYVLIASVPTTVGEAACIHRLARSSLAATAASRAQHRLLKELIWQQQEPILAAAEMGEDANRLGPLLVLNRDKLSLYQHETDRWEVQDTKRVPATEKAARAPRGEIHLSFGAGEKNSILLPDQACEVEVAEKLALNCREASNTWALGMLLTSSCSQEVSIVRAGSGDWSVPDRLLLRNPSSEKTAPSLAELDLPGPVLSISAGLHLKRGTVVVFNLSTGNYEVYRITLVCGN
jgi:hypothetical protein